MNSSIFEIIYKIVKFFNVNQFCFTFKIILFQSIINFISMNLSLLSHYFSTLLHSQTTLNLNRNTIPSTSNAFALYKLLAPKSQPQVDAAMMINFIKSFTYNFQNN